jgi:hypothetical protein
MKPAPKNHLAASRVGRVFWNAVTSRKTPKKMQPPPHMPLLLVTSDRVLRAIGKPSIGIDIGYYLAAKDSFDCPDGPMSGDVLYWALLPDPPWDLIREEH